MKQFSEACEQNKHPIMAVLERSFSDAQSVLEIGSGTGQHAVFFAAHLPQLVWQTSDLAEHHPSISAWLDEAALDNTRMPLVLDVRNNDWPTSRYDGVFSANTTHIMGWPAVVAMFAGIGQILAPGGTFCLYGPFNYHGDYTSDSNARFDAWLKQRDQASGIRHFEDLVSLANDNGLQLESDNEMPANNRLLVWVKDSG